jgi:hypothetical protein
MVLSPRTVAGTTTSGRGAADGASAAVAGDRVTRWRTWRHARSPRADTRRGQPIGVLTCPSVNALA